MAELTIDKPTLRKGSTGKAVGELQILLNLVPVDEKFGVNTEAAVKKFQKANNLKTDGIVGKQTWTALLAKAPQSQVQIEIGPAVITSSPGPDTPITPTNLEGKQMPDNFEKEILASGKPTLRNGSGGIAVEELQTLLNQALNANLTVDGKFGPGTQAAVQQFQSSNGLTVDGVVGAQTWTALLTQKPKTAAQETAQKTVESAKKTVQAAVEKVKSNSPLQNILLGAGIFVATMFAMVFTSKKH